MSELLYGNVIAAEIKKEIKEIVDTLAESGRRACIAMVRVGDNSDDISYTNSIARFCHRVGVETLCVVLPLDASQHTLEESIEKLNKDSGVSGIIVMRPLPSHLNEDRLRTVISPFKDIDGWTADSITGLVTGNFAAGGFPPCTAQAVIRLLDYYNLDISGKDVVILGRSMTVGTPLALMLMHRDATVTVCHRKSKDAKSLSRKADIVIACAGQGKGVGRDYFSSGQLVIDVGCNVDKETSGLCGDVDYNSVKDLIGAITPVPGGIGSITTALLVLHGARAAKLN